MKTENDSSKKVEAEAETPPSQLCEVKKYKLPNGDHLSLTTDEFNELVDLFRTLAVWRDDNRNKTNI